MTRWVAFVAASMLSCALWAESAASDCEAGFAAKEEQNWVVAALEFSTCATVNGDVDAHFELGTLFKVGLGVTKDPEEAARWFLKAAQYEHSGAQVQLGHLYRSGEGVPQDYTAAVMWYRKAANQGNGMAAYNLAEAYVDGEGVPHNLQKAEEWCLQAAAAGYAREDYELARNVYLVLQSADKLLLDAPPDNMDWAAQFRKPAEMGYAKAQFHLGVLYALGEGVPQNDYRAYVWLNLAAAHLPRGGEREAAIELRETAGGRLTASQLAEAQNTASGWRPCREF